VPNARFRLYGLVAVLITAFTIGALAVPTVAGGSKPEEVRFDLFVNKTALLPCLQNGTSTPKARVSVERGKLNDELDLHISGFKPGLQFDLFTVQHSDQLANGNADPAFQNFGLAWYQSDVQADRAGRGHVEIRTILLDQIFGFDPALGLAPTNTFHVGFWFNNPSDAAPCGFTGPPTPFNGEHQAGPLAFISRPDATTGLGPLCSDPDSNKPSGCNP
jgi:hypothetical protein